MFSSLKNIEAIFNDFACTRRYKLRQRHVGHTLKVINNNKSIFDSCA